MSILKYVSFSVSSNCQMRSFSINEIVREFHVSIELGYETGIIERILNLRVLGTLKFNYRF